ncbi:MAG: 4Fe-4S dicluster domain-containing protein [Elusimicrobiota bacterium]|nr:4Fe-4S dicluster domain-containing protein [Elusimicrobiota bacterium]
MEREEIIKKVRDAGVVGCGGAGFPTHVKIAAEAEFVIANGAECEPILKGDQYLMEEKAGEIIAGLRSVMTSSSASRGYVGLKTKYSTQSEALRKAASSGIDIFEMGNFYPAGDEHVMVHEITGRVVPEAGIPIDAGVIVDNVGTLINVSAAVEKGSPVTRKYVTVTGDVENPVIVRCAIGTRARDIVALARPRKDNYMLINGGPMMGTPVDDDFCITKTTGALIVMPFDSALAVRKERTARSSQRRAKSICDQCMDCTIACPRNLLGHRIYPHKIMRMNFFDSSEFNEITSGSFLCSQCGLCEAACPQGLSPRSVFKSVKENLVKKGYSNTLTSSNVVPHSMRELRKFSAHRLVQRLGLAKFDRPAIFYPEEIVPGKVKIALHQNVGAASEPVVEPGAEVQEGTLIAKIPEKALGANLHSSINGTVVKIDENFIYIG